LLASCAGKPFDARPLRGPSEVSGGYLSKVANARIVLAGHDPRWATQFADEALLIGAALHGVMIELHHIGSTAIPGIAAKPVIDMLAVVTSLEALDRTSSSLESLGYESKGEFGMPGRRYFRKDSASGIRTHQLHAFATGSAEIERHLSFRDYLRAHPAEARAYETLKVSLAAQSSDDARAYTEGKTAFIHEVERRAAEWRRGSPPTTPFHHSAL
jgi:GrpB-like predicted nucleotidyltransferase (UPF0157 family)